MCLKQGAFRNNYDNNVCKSKSKREDGDGGRRGLLFMYVQKRSV